MVSQNITHNFNQDVVIRYINECCGFLSKEVCASAVSNVKQSLDPGFSKTILARRQYVIFFSSIIQSSKFYDHKVVGISVSVRSSGSFLSFSIGTTFVLNQLSVMLPELIISLKIPSRYRFASSGKNLDLKNFLPSRVMTLALV
jgi:hypothetical protein